MTDQVVSRMPATVAVARGIMAVQAALGCVGLLFLAGIVDSGFLGLTLFLPALAVTATLILLVARWRSRRRWVWIAALAVEALAVALQLLPPLLYEPRLSDVLNPHLAMAVATLVLLGLRDARSWFDR
ncbi:hypothetical protein ACFXJ8_32495 [Nonomuraea sp. NPDC059194]|uniref:hypothetical protein n=1 Tax=Nonomuraea sp. NPDC059194 TaxID=3346764 RepID=UPI0036CB95EF